MSHVHVVRERSISSAVVSLIKYDNLDYDGGD